jgi:hypothetical protein
VFKLNYRQIFNFSLPKALVRYRNNSWFREKLFVWTAPAVTRDSLCLLFVVSFCFFKHSSSHFLLLYVIISVSIYYYWVRFQQLKYTEPLHGKLQTVFDLSFDIRYLTALVPLSTFFAGFFAYICTIGVYLFYAAKSILLMSDRNPFHGFNSVANFVGCCSGGWIQSAKTSSAGFFPRAVNELGSMAPLNLEKYSSQVDLRDLPGSLLPSFVYIFDNMGAAPFFGRFTTDLEILKVLENFSFEKFSLFQFFIFTYRTAFRVWIPLFSGGYRNFLIWWIHPASEASVINLLGQPRYLFEPFILAVSLVLENSIHQIYASFYMDRWVFPLCAFLNQQGFPFSWFVNFVDFRAVADKAGQQPTKLATGLTHFMDFQYTKFGHVGCTKPTNLSKFVLLSIGYILKYAPIYVPCEQGRYQTIHKIAEIFFSPFIFGCKLFLFTLKAFINFSGLSCMFNPEIAFTWIWIGFNPATIFNPF